MSDVHISDWDCEYEEFSFYSMAGSPLVCHPVVAASSNGVLHVSERQDKMRLHLTSPWS